MRVSLLPVSLCRIVVVWLGLVGIAGAAQYDLHSGDHIEQIVPSLQPGDTVVMHAGTYGHAWIQELHGAADAWITIRGAEGEARPLITYASPDKNVWDVENVSFVKFQDLEITGGSDGIKFGFGSTNHHVTIERLRIHSVGNVAINASSIVELSNLTVRDCELDHTGSATGGHGEGLYLGVASGNYQPQVHDSLIEHNYIHDLGGSHGDGVEIKHGCYNVVVQDNVFSVHYACPSVTVWGTYKDDPAFNNIIRRNFIWRPVDAGIQATGETTIENNIIIGSNARGLSIRGRDGDLKMQYMRIVNNTIFRADGDAAVSLYQWDVASGGVGLVFANNAVFQDAPNKVAIRAASGLDNGTFSGNLYYGSTYIAGNPPSVPGLTPANPPDQQFPSISIYPGQMNVYPLPGSQLIDAADPVYVPWGDFNLQGRPVGAGCDVGAYEVGPASNPGWPVTLGFKDMNAVPPAPRPILSVDPADGIIMAAWPGQFVLPCSRKYTVSNTGAVTLDWTVAVSVSWASVNSSGGTLAPGESTTVTVTLSDEINNLPAGHYNVPVRFTNTVSGDGSTAVPISLTALSPAKLDVTPATGVSGVKKIADWDTPYCLYKVSNTGDLPLNWTVSADQDWVSFQSYTDGTPISGGTLEPQASVSLYAYINWLTDEMPVGTYTGTITFDGSASNGGVQTRDVSFELTWAGDINRDGAVDVTDLLALIAGFGITYPDSRFDWNCDLNWDLTVDVIDLLIMIDDWGKVMP